MLAIVLGQFMQPCDIYIIHIWSYYLFSDCEVTSHHNNFNCCFDLHQVTINKRYSWKWGYLYKPRACGDCAPVAGCWFFVMRRCSQPRHAWLHTAILKARASRAKCIHWPIQWRAFTERKPFVPAARGDCNSFKWERRLMTSGAITIQAAILTTLSGDYYLGPRMYILLIVKTYDDANLQYVLRIVDLCKIFSEGKICFKWYNNIWPMLIDH